MKTHSKLTYIWSEWKLTRSKHIGSLISGPNVSSQAEARRPELRRSIKLCHHELLGQLGLNLRASQRPVKILENNDQW